MIIKKLENSNYKFADNKLVIEYEGQVDFTNVISDLVILLKKHEVKKDENN